MAGWFKLGENLDRTFLVTKDADRVRIFEVLNDGRKIPADYLIQSPAQRARQGADWFQADWTKSNQEIAEDLGVSRERVRQIRDKYGIPKVNAMRAGRDERVAEAVRLAATRTAREIAQALGVSVETARGYLRQEGVRAKRSKRSKQPCKYPWDDVDWENKYDSEIARELGCSSVAVLHARRRQGRPRGPDGRKVGRRHNAR